MTAVRRIARAGGHALPADVPPAKQYVPPPAAAPGPSGPSAAEVRRRLRPRHGGAGHPRRARVHGRVRAQRATRARAPIAANGRRTAGSVSRMAARGAYATGLARREAILRAASEAFATHGYRGASLAMIAERVGMSAPGLLHHFPTKEHLLDRPPRAAPGTGRRARQGARERTRGAHPRRSPRPGQRNADSPGLVRLFTMLAAESVDDDHPGHDWFVERYRQSREFVAERLIEEQRVGLIRDDVDRGADRRADPRHVRRPAAPMAARARTRSTWSPRWTTTSATSARLAPPAPRPAVGD